MSDMESVPNRGVARISVWEGPHRSSAEGARRTSPRPDTGIEKPMRVGCGEGCPSAHLGRVWGGGCPLPRNFILILYQNGEFWCILGSN